MIDYLLIVALAVFCCLVVMLAWQALELPAPPVPAPVQRHARRAAGLSIAGGFWILAMLRSLRQHTLRPLIHRVEYRGIVNLLRR